MTQLSNADATRIIYRLKSAKVGEPLVEDQYTQVGRWLMAHIDRVQLFWDKGTPQRLERIKLDCKADSLTTDHPKSMRAMVMRDICGARDAWPFDRAAAVQTNGSHRP